MRSDVRRVTKCDTVLLLIKHIPRPDYLPLNLAMNGLPALKVLHYVRLTIGSPLSAREFVPENDITYLGNECPLYLD